jgi:DICT domain-containing protein
MSSSRIQEIQEIQELATCRKNAEVVVLRPEARPRSDHALKHADGTARLDREVVLAAVQKKNVHELTYSDYALRRGHD